MHAAFRALTRTPRRGLVAVVMTVSIAMTLAVVPSAPADELNRRERKVGRAIEQAQEHLRHSSDALVRASVRVRRAADRLQAAESTLESRRAQAAAAAVVSAQMQSELAAATARLGRAQDALAQGRRSHADQAQVLRGIAAATYQAGSPALMGLTLVLTSRDPSDLSSQLNVVQNVVDKEAATLRRFEASAVLLEMQRARVAEARADVARRAEIAAETLVRQENLEAQAAAAATRVRTALREHGRARAEAALAKRSDQRRLRQLRDERDQVSLLIRRAEAELRRKHSKAAVTRAREASRSRTSPMLPPVDSSVTSPYGMRLHPVYRAWRLHDGTDFGAACGRPVRAAADGTVIGRYYNVGYGNRVIIRHGYLRGAAVTTTYNHLSRYSSGPGQRVRRGDVIGHVGTTGYSTGCHLHFMVFRNGRTVDPMLWLP